MHAVLLLTCRTASRDSLKTSEKFNIVFLAPSDSVHKCFKDWVNSS